MPLTTWGETATIYRLSCDDCGAILDAHNLGTLAVMVKTQNWETDIEIDGFTPATVIAECPKCKEAK